MWGLVQLGECALLPSLVGDCPLNLRLRIDALLGPVCLSLLP